MRKNQEGFSAVELVLIVLIVGIIGLCGWYVFGRNAETTNSGRKPIDILSEAEMRILYDCDRITADARATDVYCSDYPQYVADVRNGLVLELNDFNKHYEQIHKRIVQRRDGCDTEKSINDTLTEEYVMCRVYVLAQDLTVGQQTEIVKIVDPDDYQFFQLNLNGTYLEVEAGQYIVTDTDRTLLYDPVEDRILLDLNSVE